ncbi:hypothetical protein H9L39_17249 [Fusarium oxysporum f. sp. albedinis]|nr:hypothetical protein H9L39_17249 [Fusarium oxysporum f. sp. albedinis]
MQECITEGSIVVVNITDLRSDATIISSNSLRTVALPELSASDARSWAKRAQEALVAQDANTMLIAAMPTSPKGPGDKKAPKKLPGVEEEMREILILTRPHTNAVALTHPSADQVLEVLKTCRIAHFACHGKSDTFDPCNSGLILQNEQNLARPWKKIGSQSNRFRAYGLDMRRLHTSRRALQRKTRRRDYRMK